MNQQVDADIVDEEILDELMDLLGEAVPAGLAEAFDLFLTSVPVRLAAVEHALAEGRLDAATQTAHSLRGSAGAFGARRLSELAGRQEQLCATGDGAAAAAMLEPMRSQFATVEVLLRSRLSGLAG